MASRITASWVVTVLSTAAACSGSEAASGLFDGGAESADGGGTSPSGGSSSSGGGSSSGGTAAGSSSGSSSGATHSSSSGGASSSSGGGGSSGSVGTSDGGVCGVKLTTGVPPSKNFDLSTWELTLPTGATLDPTIIGPSQLTGGYTSQYFFTGPDGSMDFWAPVTGVTTMNSKYPRSELREMKGGSEYNWSLTAGTATLSASVAVTQLPPPSGKVVVGQIHANGTSDLPLLELAYKGTGVISAEILPTFSSTTQTDTQLASGVALGECFTYTIQTDSSALLQISVNGQTGYKQTVDASWEAATFYFKAGDYVQENTGASTDGAAVSFYSLSVSH